MARFVLPIAALLALAFACGDDNGGENTEPPTPTTAVKQPAEPSSRFMSLRDAREYLATLGLEGTSLDAERYECIQSTCPSETPGEDSWGCLSVLPTGDPQNIESLLPDDPPRWYSVVWNGAYGETYAAPPEPVVNEPRAEYEPRQDIACGNGTNVRMTAAEAVELLADAGLSSGWQYQGELASPTCPAGAECPIPGNVPESEGCLGFWVAQIPEVTSDPANALVTLFVSWESAAGRFSYSIPTTIGRAQELAPAADPACNETIGQPSDPYDWVPYTQVIQQTYWELAEAPAGKTLRLMVAVGGSCESYERVEVEQTGDAVTINAFRRHTTGGPYTACDDSLSWEPVTVDLDEPLGVRELLGCAPEEIWYLDHERNCAEFGAER